MAITLVALGTALGMMLIPGWHQRLALPSLPLWPLLGLLALGAFQLLPLPPGLHRVLAPASYSMWCPPEPVAVSVLGSDWKPMSIFPEATRGWLGFTMGLVALGLLAGPALNDRRRASRVAGAVCLAGLAVGLYGIAARALFGSLLYGHIAVPTVAPFGPFVSKNHFAGYVEMAALVSLGLATGLADEARRGPSLLSWVESRRAGRVVITYGATATMVLAILVSLSRGGVVSLSIGVLTFVLLRVLVGRRAPSRLRVVGSLVVLTVVGLASLLVIPKEGRDRILSLGGVASDQSGAFRLGTWRDTLRVAWSSPIGGQGLGAFEDALPRFKTAGGELRIQHAENDYLELLAEGGSLGLALGLLAVVLTATHLLPGLRRQNDRLLRGIGLGAAAGATALIVHGAFDFNLRIPSNALLFTLLAAMAVSAAIPLRRLPIGHTQRWRVALSLALVAAVSRAIVMPTSPPEELLQKGTESPLRRLRTEANLVDHLRRRPSDAGAWLLLAWLRSARGDRLEGTALARYAAGLDPTWEPLQRESVRLSEASRRE